MSDRAGEMMMFGEHKSVGGDVQVAAVVAEVCVQTPSSHRDSHKQQKFGQRVTLQPAGTQFSPEVLLAVLIGLLALGACIAPWPRCGWLFFEVMSATVALLVFGDGLTLWLARDECAPVLLPPEKGLRGREGQMLQIPLALTSARRSRFRREVHLGLMAATHESEAAFYVTREPQRLLLEHSDLGQGEQPENTRIRLWQWTPEIKLLRRGLWPGPRVGIERRSKLRLWRLRRWFDVPEPLRIEADLRSGRSEILRSQVYRALVAAQQTPWTGHGRDFERLREYQPGDNYSEIAWKTTARRGAPVSRLFQWEQRQEVYFVVDQSRASALSLQSDAPSVNDIEGKRRPRQLLDLFVKTALVGATVALELGDEFGLVTYADEPKRWLRAGSGQFHFHQFRERLLTIDSLPTIADYEALFTDIRARLRRRAYLLLLADLTERPVADSLRRGIGVVKSSHALLMTSILPAHAQPAFSPEQELHSDQDVYAALTGEKENQRLSALARQLRHLDVQLQYVPEGRFLRTAVEGYLESKREQRL